MWFEVRQLACHILMALIVIGALAQVVRESSRVRTDCYHRGQLVFSTVGDKRAFEWAGEGHVKLPDGKVIEADCRATASPAP